jgi:hypothetical protein
MVADSGTSWRVKQSRRLTKGKFTTETRGIHGQERSVNYRFTFTTSHLFGKALKKLHNEDGGNYMLQPRGRILPQSYCGLITFVVLIITKLNLILPIAEWNLPG